MVITIRQKVGKGLKRFEKVGRHFNRGEFQLGLEKSQLGFTG